MINRASAIIISKRHILLIHRIRFSREYFVFPGGHIEEGESAKEACIREVLEETGLQTAWLQPAFEYATSMKMDHYFFVKIYPGNMMLGGPEAQKQSEKNRYLLEWIPLVQVNQFNLQPEAVRDALAMVIALNGPIFEAADLAPHREKLQNFLLDDRTGSILCNT